MKMGEDIFIVAPAGGSSLFPLFLLLTIADYCNCSVEFKSLKWIIKKFRLELAKESLMMDEALWPRKTSIFRAKMDR
jgi:hypothetical protein